VDITPAGKTITLPTEHLFIPVTQIIKVRYVWLLRPFVIKEGRRKIKFGKLIEI
jgi:hypothetical protein